MDAIRHGDIIITKTKRCAVKGMAPIVGASLATGSATGHSHTYRPAKGAKQYDKGDGVRLLRVTEPVRLSHEEHKTVSLEPGYYLVSAKRQYDRDNGWVNVAD